jgi:glutamate-1-semialdehyde aminotransferase
MQVAEHHSPKPDRMAQGAAPIADWCPNPAIHPTLVKKRFAARLVDSHGREWVDFLSGWGSNILGYDHPRVLDAIRDQLEEGVGTGVRTEAYGRVEQLLRAVIPCAEQVAFGKNGSDATTGAARLARAVTGRDRVLVRGYHGFHDWCLASDRSIKGIPTAFRDAVGELPINDLKALDAILEDEEHDVAAVMIDAAAIPVPDADYLAGLVDLCRRYEVLVVFDEVVTGFRLAVGGAQESYGVVPDLACFSKAMANGMPISALVGSGELMAALPSTRYGMTFGSEAVSLAAAAATISEIRDRDVCRRRDHNPGFRRVHSLRGGCVLRTGLRPHSSIVVRKQTSVSRSLQPVYLSRDRCRALVPQRRPEDHEDAACRAVLPLRPRLSGVHPTAYSEVRPHPQITRSCGFGEDPARSPGIGGQGREILFPGARGANDAPRHPRARPNSEVVLPGCLPHRQYQRQPPMAIRLRELWNQ